MAVSACERCASLFKQSSRVPAHGAQMEIGGADLKARNGAIGAATKYSCADCSTVMLKLFLAGPAELSVWVYHEPGAGFIDLPT